MHLSMKPFFKWMHGYGENAKMAEGDGGQFLGKRALEFSEIDWTCYHHPYPSPLETTWQIDAWFSSYGKDKFLLYVFLYPIVEQSIL